MGAVSPSVENASKCLIGLSVSVLRRERNRIYSREDDGTFVRRMIGRTVGQLGGWNQ